jgi:hypothetical protein
MSERVITKKIKYCWQCCYAIEWKDRNPTACGKGRTKVDILRNSPEVGYKRIDGSIIPDWCPLPVLGEETE